MYRYGLLYSSRQTILRLPQPGIIGRPIQWPKDLTGLRSIKFASIGTFADDPNPHILATLSDRAKCMLEAQISIFSMEHHAPSSPLIIRPCSTSFSSFLLVPSSSYCSSAAAFSFVAGVQSHNTLQHSNTSTLRAWILGRTEASLPHSTTVQTAKVPTLAPPCPNSIAKKGLNQSSLPRWRMSLYRWLRSSNTAAPRGGSHRPEN